MAVRNKTTAQVKDDIDSIQTGTWGTHIKHFTIKKRNQMIEHTKRRLSKMSLKQRQAINKDLKARDKKRKKRSTEEYYHDYNYMVKISKGVK